MTPDQYRKQEVYHHHRNQKNANSVDSIQDGAEKSVVIYKCFNSLPLRSGHPSLYQLVAGEKGGTGRSI